MDPWLVLAAELSVERSAAAERTARFEAIRTIAPSRSVLLANTSPQEALEAAGLSTHSAGVLVSAALGLLELFDGQVPDDDLELRAIPGVGDSVAKAVLCFGHGRNAVPLHSAAARVAARMAGRDETGRWQLRLDLYRLAGPAGPDAKFSAAVIHLGNEICRPERPLCSACPLERRCETARSVYRRARTAAA